MSNLSEEALEALKLQDSRLCDSFRAEKFQKETKKHWDLFYKRNETRFFKDRHWTTREFQELLNNDQEHHQRRRILLEVGCGVGNFVFPLLEDSTSFYIYACDLSPRAVELVKSNDKYNEDQIKAFQCDITSNDCFQSDIKEKVDIVSLIFVLSAIRPSLFLQVLKNIHDILDENGLLIFRDYAVNDMAMFRFKPGAKIGDRHYLRQDGTTTYFFSLEEMNEMAQQVGLTVEISEYVQRRTVNKKEDIDVQRTFLQCKYRKKM